MAHLYCDVHVLPIEINNKMKHFFPEVLVARNSVAQWVSVT